MLPVNKNDLKSITKSKLSQKEFDITVDNRHRPPRLYKTKLPKSNNKTEDNMHRQPRLYKNHVIKSNNKTAIEIKSAHKEVNDGDILHCNSCGYYYVINPDSKKTLLCPNCDKN